MSENKKMCIFNLRRYCRVIEYINDPKARWGSADWVKVYCAMCVKATYARAKFKMVNRYSVVNTL